MKNRIYFGRMSITIFFIMCISFALSSFALATFTSNPRINSGSTTVYTDQDLDCKWTIDITTTANVTWYKDGITNNTYSRNCTSNVECTTEGSGNIPQSSTTKGQTWTCEVSYYNGTDTEISNNSRTIEDSSPSTPRVFLASNEIYNSSISNISEDNVTLFQVNSTDADNDTITYITFSDEIPVFCSISSTTGVFTCSPTEESDIGEHSVTVYAKSGLKTSGFNFNINVIANNDPPYFSPVLSDKQKNEGTALDYTIYGADAENNTPYNFSVQSDLGNIIIVQLSNNSASIRFNHSGEDIAQFSDKGNHTINVTITDSGNPQELYSSSFNLEVLPTNHIANITIYVENSSSLIQAGELLIRVNATDIDNDTITFSTSNSQLYNISYGTTDKSNPNGTSFANATIYVNSMTNDYVIYNNITIIAFDSKENSSIDISLNITNVNDAPVINEISNHPSNTLENSNISNLTAYTGVLFNYIVNATDIDSQTYASETLTYSSNDSNFPINSSTGLLSFTNSNAGTHEVTITATDSGLLTDTAIAIINIYNNENPYFNSNITLNCMEYDINNNPSNCFINISSYTNDSDIGDYVVNYWSNSTLFTINETTGVINFSANQSMVGNYSFLINITDTRGGVNTTIMQVRINNTNNAPTITDITEPLGRLIVAESYNYGILADDDDLDLGTYENLTFNYSVAGPNSSIFTLTKSSETEATLSLNPLTSIHAGNYTVNITITDFYNNATTNTINFFIYNITTAPNITQIKPYGTPLVSGSINDSWINTSSLGRYNTTITILENTTYLFNQTTTYDTSYDNSLSYKWYYDGVQVSSAQYYSKYFNFFSSGMHNITLTATDEFNKNASFLWIINITNVNRPPTLLNPLTNLTGANAINGTTTFAGFMTYYNSQAKFYDPDDDLDVDNIDEDNESTLSFSATSCTHATISFINNSLRVQSLSIGECIVNFTAIDSANSSETAESLNILVNVTYVSNETVTEEVPTTSNSGGGSSTRTITIPIPEEVERPKPLQIITPKLVTIYKNATVIVPIVLNNTWNDTLEGITLTASTNATNVSINLDRTYFPRLETGKDAEVTLTIANYKSEGHYEIQILAKVINPDFTDTATIYVNSADTKSEGEQLETMISFARDLLSSNPECQELTELLNEAKKELSINNYEGTAKLVDSVINGCKYLVSSGSQVEKPSKEFINRFTWKSAYNNYAIIVGFALLFLVAIYYIVKGDHKEDM